ncbi:MAG: hypothetical protein H6822_09040 [Planctomycetaceae bacterium]|nr:hypothetical protein [Planctomycetales bacterium]MCB9922220.1 hypothetical protein [Planctomycetaceae bacterium]MCB9922315.1 hypothetical protein [Planctomycetaceae bacterium]
MELVVSPKGVVRCLYEETLPIATLGALQIARASHVEPDPKGQWYADLAPVDGPRLGPFERRSEALTAERDWIYQHRLLAVER